MGLGSLSIDAVCEKLRQIQGLDSGMLEEYINTVKKVILKKSREFV